MANAYKHAAMALRPTAETLTTLSTVKNCPTITHTENRDTITQPNVLKMSKALYREGKYIIFKSELPHVVDLFERVEDNKIKQIASFYRQSDEAALAAGKAHIRVRSIKCKEP